MDVKKYMYRTELHAHTKPASMCAHVTADEVVRRYAEAGYDSIVICNHFFPGMPFADNKAKCIDAYMTDYYKAFETGEKLGIDVILGCEIRFSENINDYLLFGIDEDFFGWAYDILDDGVENFSRKFRSETTLLIQAHPFRDGMTKINPGLLDGIESFNLHPGHNSRIGFSSKYALENDFIRQINRYCAIVAFCHKTNILVI